MSDVRESTTCSKCHRAVWTTDVDDVGRCCFCAGAPSTRVIEVPEESRTSVIGASDILSREELQTLEELEKEELE